MQAPSFKQYCENKRIAAFHTRLENLCSEIANSDVSFDDFWVEAAMPVLLEKECRDEDEMLTLIEWGWKDMMGGMRNMFSGGNTATQDLKNRTQQQGAQQWINQNDPHVQRRAAQEKRVGAFQQKADQWVAAIKQRFSVAMKDFLKAVTDDAKNQNNPHMWQVAKSFYQKIMSNAQPVIDQFSMKAKAGQAGYRDQFGQEVGQMQKSQQQSNTDALKQRLAQKQHGAQQAQIGQLKQNPEVQAMRQKMQQGYNPIDGFDRGNNTVGGPQPASQRAPV